MSLISFLAAQRFRCFQEEVVVTKGEPLILSVGYLSFLPEASSLKIMTLVAEADRNNFTFTLLRNYSAHYVVHDPKPGTYHFQVMSKYGKIQSASFNVTIVGMCRCRCVLCSVICCE